ncbi:MAG: glycoside hydrolase family 6 protein [Myxococcota bacterium]|nr:glycoside hydrolase family 6 protein [Myxococcota bacterium]
MTIARLPISLAASAILVACAPSTPGTPVTPASAGPNVSPGDPGTPGGATAAPLSNADAQAAAKVPPRVKGQNPFTGVRFYINDYSPAAMAAQNWKPTRPNDAKLLEKIAIQPSAQWMGEWSGDIETAVHNLGKATNAKGTVPVVVAYNIPNRDCGQYSKGGSASPDAYRKWIREFAKAAGSFRMIVVLEPDALGHLTQCLSPADQEARLALLKDAVDVLEATPGISVYLDAGHAKWIAAPEMAKRLNAAGIANADGFALNTSNYVSTEENIAYGHALSAATGGKHFIIDTSRNGNGPTADAQWCNPDGRALGNAPTANTGDPAVDAFFWVKPPGESDGACNGGPKAGEFWADAALGMAKRAKW